MTVTETTDQRPFLDDAHESHLALGRLLAIGCGDERWKTQELQAKRNFLLAGPNDQLRNVTQVRSKSLDRPGIPK